MLQAFILAVLMRSRCVNNRNGVSQHIKTSCIHHAYKDTSCALKLKIVYRKVFYSKLFGVV